MVRWEPTAILQRQEECQLASDHRAGSFARTQVVRSLRSSAGSMRMPVINESNGPLAWVLSLVLFAAVVLVGSISIGVMGLRSHRVNAVTSSSEPRPPFSSASASTNTMMTCPAPEPEVPTIAAIPYGPVVTGAVGGATVCGYWSNSPTSIQQLAPGGSLDGIVAALNASRAPASPLDLASAPDFLVILGHGAGSTIVAVSTSGAAYVEVGGGSDAQAWVPSAQLLTLLGESWCGTRSPSVSAPSPIATGTAPPTSVASPPGSSPQETTASNPPSTDPPAQIGCEDSPTPPTSGVTPAS